MKIEQVIVHPQIQEILRNQGITEFYPPQAEALPYALKGEHLVLSIPTAAGKRGALAGADRCDGQARSPGRRPWKAGDCADLLGQLVQAVHPGNAYAGKSLRQIQR